MAPLTLTGRRGWTTVASLTAVLAVLVTGQLPSAHAAAAASPLVSAAAVSAPAATPADVDGTR
ncbi:MAG: hypothetical protein JWN08_1943, partial [Frankiales bacterium]|nr:hypothetical protein [Frankiales bacterium]